MQNDDAQPYRYYLLNEQDYTFGFVTNQRVEYRISFRSTDYLFPTIHELANQTFELIISPVFTPKHVKPKLDGRISLTIIEIIKDLYLHLPENVTFYICESSDGRYKTRQRLFTSWFNIFQEDKTFLKIDVALDKRRPEEIDFSIIVRQSNPYKNRILHSLEQLKENIESEKPNN